MSVAEVELRALAEERDKLLNDANYGSLQNDEAVTRARQERDEAIERKKTAEVRNGHTNTAVLSVIVTNYMTMPINSVFRIMRR